MPPALFAALATGRLVDLPASIGYGSWDADGNTPQQSWRAALLAIVDDRPGERPRGWRERLAASSTGSGPFDEALARLDAQIPVDAEVRHLTYSDLLNFYVLV